MPNPQRTLNECIESKHRHALPWRTGVGFLLDCKFSAPVPVRLKRLLDLRALCLARANLRCPDPINIFMNSMIRLGYNFGIKQEHTTGQNGLEAGLDTNVSPLRRHRQVVPPFDDGQ